MTTVVVAGGGISGILSAILLSKKYDQVVLIEKNRNLGGLLNSYQSDTGLTFDYGTHFISETSNEDLNALMLEKIRDEEENWHILDRLPTGTVFRGSVSNYSACINTNSLPDEIRDQGILDMLALSLDEEGPYQNAYEKLSRFYGKTFTEHVFRPSLKKLYGFELEDLAADAHTLFVPQRLIALSPTMTRELKKIPFFDDRLAYHVYDERLSGRNVYYPKQGGIGNWIGLLKKKLQEVNVSVITDDFINEVHVTDNKISSVVLDRSKQSIDCDHLVWTIPSFLLLKAANMEMRISPPKFRSTILFHFAFDQNFLTDLVYMTCYDPEYSFFRITFYDNIGGSSTEREVYRCTVEVITDRDVEIDPLRRQVLHEMQNLGLVHPESRLIFEHIDQIVQGFPVLTHQFVDAVKKQQAAVEHSFRNVTLAEGP